MVTTCAVMLAGHFGDVRLQNRIHKNSADDLECSRPELCTCRPDTTAVAPAIPFSAMHAHEPPLGKMSRLQLWALLVYALVSPVIAKVHRHAWLQIVTTGTDRKIAYWDAYDGSAVRVVDASEDSAICDVHVDCEGVALVSGSVDSRVLVRPPFSCFRLSLLLVFCFPLIGAGAMICLPCL